MLRIFLFLQKSFSTKEQSQHFMLQIKKKEKKKRKLYDGELSLNKEKPK